MNKTLKNILSNYKFSIALAFLLLLVLLIFLHKHINPFFALINVAFIFSVLLLISTVKNSVVRVLLASITCIILSMGLTFAVLFSAPLSLGNIASIFETNQAEAFTTPTEIYIFFVFCLLTTTILSVKAINEMKGLFSVGKSALIFLVIVVFINISAILVPVWRNSNFLSGYKKDLQELPLQTIYAFSSIRSPLLYGDILGLIVYGYEKIDYWRYRGIEKVETHGMFLDSEITNRPPKIYLVVGESACRERMSIYGYEKPTTPFLDSLAQEDPNPLHYYNGIAIANTTRDAIRFSLSFATPRSPVFFWRGKNIVEMAKDAGYHTVWLSNQGQAGLYDNYPSYIARSSDEVYFEPKLKKDDLNLLSLLDNYHQEEEKQFIVMHLMGSHFPFNERFDNEDTRLEDDYDKSIHHTDRFLRKLFYYAKKRDENSIIIYFSDHGASPTRGIHGLKNAEISEYEIPLIVLDNTALSLPTWGILNKYLDEDTNTINNLSMSHMLAEFLGYSVDQSAANDVIEQGRSVMMVDGSLVDFSDLRILKY